MNMKENILLLRNERTTTGEVDKTGRTELGKCIHLYDVTQGNTSVFDRKLSSSNARKIDREIITEEGSKKKTDKKLM